jgi:YbbR domain-containing protein
MKTLLKNFFLSHWERKAISAILAIIIWLVVNQSQTTYRMLDDISVRVINIPQGMTVEGMQSNGILLEKISLTLSGNKTYLDEITSNDLEVVIDATDKSGEWLVSVTRKNLVPLNPDIDLSKTVARVSPVRLPVLLTRLVTEKIPVVVTYPIGESPRDYQFLDVWPYHLYLTVSGPEATVKQLKAKGLNLTFNLNQISRAELDNLQTVTKSDEISFVVPEEWKEIVIPSISTRPIAIDDPQAKHLRIDFVRCELHPIAKAIPVSLFYPPEYSLTLNPETYRLAIGGVVQNFHGLNMVRKSLYAKGVSRLFVELVQDMLDIAVVLAPKNERKFLDWSVQFINPRILEDRYVTMLMSDASDEDSDTVSSKKREEYLRNRFRNYMNRFELYNANNAPLDLKIELDGNAVVVKEGESSL